MNEIKLLLRKDIFILLNNIKLILKNPLRLLPYGLVVAYISFFYFRRTKKASEINADQLSQLEDAAGQLPEVDYALQNIIGGTTLLALIILLFQLHRATQKNISFFSMADVNFLFTAPTVPSNILLYYMVRSILPSIGGAILFTLYGTAQVEYAGLNLFNILMIGLGLGLFFFIMMPIRFLIYTLHTKYHVMPIVRQVVFGLGTLVGLMVLIPGLMAETFWKGMFAWISSPWFDFFPLVGWSRAISSYIAHENIFISLGFVAVYVLTFVMIVKLVIHHAGEYYEDVLESTKSNEELKEKAQGKAEASEAIGSLNAKKKVELKDFGTGASAIFWRNYVHSSRQDFHPLFGVYGLVIAGIGVIMSLLSHTDWFSHQVIYWYLLILMGIYFAGGMGKGNIGDLKKPYFFLIPDSWTSKFWNLIRLDIYQTAILAMMLIVPTVLIAELNKGLIILYPLAMIGVYLVGLGISMSIEAGLEEAWDKKLIKPLVLGGIFLFGILPTLGMGVFVFLVSDQFFYGFLAMTTGFLFLAAVMLHVAIDVVKRIEFKEM